MFFVLILALLTLIVHAVEGSSEKQIDVDDPSKAWDEWDEDEKMRLFPKRVRDADVGTNLYAALGSVMRQRKHVVGELKSGWASNAVLSEAQAMVTRFEQMLKAGGIGATVFMPDKARLVVRTETVLDAYLARDFLLKQAEIHRVLIDAMPFTRKPIPTDEDGEEDDHYEGEL